MMTVFCSQRKGVRLFTLISSQPRQTNISPLFVQFMFSVTFQEQQNCKDGGIFFFSFSFCNVRNKIVFFLTPRQDERQIDRYEAVELCVSGQLEFG